MGITSVLADEATLGECTLYGRYPLSLFWQFSKILPKNIKQNNQKTK